MIPLASDLLNRFRGSSCGGKAFWIPSVRQTSFLHPAALKCRPYSGMSRGDSGVCAKSRLAWQTTHKDRGEPAQGSGSRLCVTAQGPALRGLKRPSVIPKPFEPIWRKRSVPRGVLDVPMSQIGLQGTSILTIVRQL
jgi:hypothetical protein